MTLRKMVTTILLPVILSIVIVALIVVIAIVVCANRYNERAEKRSLPLENPENYAGYEYISDVYQNNKDSINIYTIDDSDASCKFKIGFVEDTTNEDKAKIILDFHNALQKHIENSDVELSISFYNSFIKQSQPYDILMRTDKSLFLDIDSNILPLENLSEFYGVSHLKINYYFIKDDIDDFAEILSDTNVEELTVSRIDSYVDEKQLEKTKNELQTIIESVSTNTEIEISY